MGKLTRFSGVSFWLSVVHTAVVDLHEGTVWSSGTRRTPRGVLVKGVEEKRDANDEILVFIFVFVSDFIFRCSIP